VRTGGECCPACFDHRHRRELRPEPPPPDRTHRPPTLTRGGPMNGVRSLASSALREGRYFRGAFFGCCDTTEHLPEKEGLDDMTATGTRETGGDRGRGDEAQRRMICFCNIASDGFTLTHLL
jgi:hypothetical protein